MRDSGTMIRHRKSVSFDRVPFNIHIALTISHIKKNYAIRERFFITVEFRSDLKVFNVITASE